MKTSLPNDNKLNLLRMQYQEIGINFRTVWDFYLKFYIAFMTLNFTALGLVIQYMHANRGPIVISFILQNLISAGTAIGVGLISKQSAFHQQEVLNACLGIDEKLDKNLLEFSAPIPVKLAVYSSWANAASQFLFIVCWIAVYFSAAFQK